MKRFFLILLLFFPAAVWSGPLRVSRIEILNQTGVPNEEIRNVLTIKEGNPFNQKELERSVSYLEKWGRFSDVKAGTQHTQKGVVVSLSLREGLRISAIHISGNYPYLSRRLHRRIAIHTGDFFDADFAKGQKERLREFYERSGYFGADVTLKVVPAANTGFVELHYHIHKGDRYRLGEISIKGNTIFPAGYFVSALNPLILYRPSRLRDSLKKMNAGYQEKGYLQARVRATRIVRDEKTRKVHIDLVVREGAHFSVSFNGNRKISNKSLKKILPLYTEGDASPLGIEDSAAALTQHYRSHGFLKAVVTGKRKRKSLREILISFNIYEGPQTQVKKIIIEGNKKLSNRRIKRRLTTEEESIFNPGYYRPATVEKDFLNLPGIFQARGFLEARSLSKKTEMSPLEDKATVTFFVEENRESRIDSITFEGNKEIPSRNLTRLLKIDIGDRLNQEDLERDRLAIKNYYLDLGYAYAHVKPHLLQEGDQVWLSFSIEEGPLVRVGQILMLGNQRTRPPAIRRALPLKTGKPFSIKKLLMGESSLRRMGVFRAVDIEPIGLIEKQETVHLLVKVEENPISYIDLESSYDTDNKFTGAVSLQHNNIMGYAKRAIFRLTGGQDIQRGELNYIDPRLLGLNMEMVSGGLFEAEQRPGFSAIDTGGKISLLHEFTSRTAVLGKYELTRTFFRGVADPTELTERDHTTSKVGLSFSYDSRDSFSDPTKGITALAGVDLSNKIIASGFNFIQPKGSLAHFYSFARRFTLLNYARVEGIEVFGSDILTRDEKLFLGGDYSVRGFGQDALGPKDSSGDPTGGHLLFLHTIELQLRIKGEFKFATFLDTGSITHNSSDIGLASWRHSAGAGLRYVTPIGPLRLDYGIKLDRISGESFGRLHFTFGYAF